VFLQGPLSDYLIPNLTDVHPYPLEPSLLARTLSFSSYPGADFIVVSAFFVLGFIFDELCISLWRLNEESVTGNSQIVVSLLPSNPLPYQSLQKWGTSFFEALQKDT